MNKTLVLIATHLTIAGAGFIAGIYTLPILMAPAAPENAAVNRVEQAARFQGEFVRDLQDSDFLHWGEGVLSLSDTSIALRGQLAPGPAYRLYLSPEFVETEAAFKRLKDRMALVGNIDTFDNFMIPVPASVDPTQYTTAIVWCESFEQFITAAKYR